MLSEFCEWLLIKGVDPNIQCSNGDTALHLAF